MTDSAQRASFQPLTDYGRHGYIGKPPFDVAVLGAGPSGTAAAIMLSRLGFSVAVFERQRKGLVRVGETLPGQIIRPLMSLGVWDIFLKASHARSPGFISLWGAPQPYERDFLFAPYGASWHLDRAEFDNMLVQVAIDRGASLYRYEQLEVTPRSEKQSWLIRAQVEGSAISVSCLWIIDATGRSSSFSRSLGVRKRAYDQLIALVGFSSDSGNADARTLIESNSVGWWYYAPLPSAVAVCAFFTDCDLLPRDMQQLQLFWRKQLGRTQLIAPQLSAGGELFSFRVFTAATTKLDKVAGDGWIAVGDAAYSYDPLSGQGIYHALQSGIAAARAISELRNTNSGAIASLLAAADSEFQNYRSHQVLHYGGERRWPNSIFWTRRHSLDIGATKP